MLHPSPCSIDTNTYSWCSEEKMMMRLLLLLFAFLELNVLVCTSFKTEVLRRFLSWGSKESRTISMIHQRNTCSLAPETGSEIDYKNNSRRASAFFVKYDEELCRSYVNVTLISKSDFKIWSSAISDATHEFQISIGQSVRKFPGNKVVTFVGDNLSVVSMLAFYDDSEMKTKNTHKVFDGLWGSLKNKTYHFRGINETELEADVATLLATSWAINTYKFQFYKSKPESDGGANVTLVWPQQCDHRDVLSISRAYTLMKDLTDSPALSLGPAELEETAVQIGLETNATSINSTVGVVALVAGNYPQIAAVGMAASEGREPRIVDIRWDAPSTGSLETAPEIVIIGKGVTFDTGGLNIKGGGGMRNMKRDMAGAAQALSLALRIVEMKLPVKLRLLLPIAENSISGIALRPGDVIRARNGKTTEITNTDAEGRLVLADALVAAVESPNTPVLVVDFATLTGAGRVALGNDIPAVFSNNMTSLQRLWHLSTTHNDLIWMMPLHEPMRPMIKSQIADLVNAADGFGGAITAALYLSEFITPVSVKDKAESVDSDGESEKPTAPPAMTWFHVDFGGSKGGAADPQGMKAVYEYIKAEHCK